MKKNVHNTPANIMTLPTNEVFKELSKFLSNLNGFRWRCRNSHDFEDVLQDALLKLWKRLLKRDADAPALLSQNGDQIKVCMSTLTAYSVGVMKNCLKDMARNRTNRKECCDGIAVEEFPNHSPSVFSVLEEKNFRRQLLDYLKGVLSDRDFNVATLWISGKKYHEIAAVMGISIGTISNVTTIVKKKIKTHFGSANGFLRYLNN